MVRFKKSKYTTAEIILFKVAGRSIALMLSFAFTYALSTKTSLPLYILLSLLLLVPLIWFLYLIPYGYKKVFRTTGSAIRASVTAFGLSLFVILLLTALGMIAIPLLDELGLDVFSLPVIRNL